MNDADTLAVAIRERDELREAKERLWADGCGLAEAYGELLDRFYRANNRVLAIKAELEHAKQQAVPGEAA